MSAIQQPSAEDYGLSLLTEEIGESIALFGLILQIIGKAGRFGIDTPGVRDPLSGAVDMSITPRTKLQEELGDVIAAIGYLGDRGVIDLAQVDARAIKKLTKLLNPDSKDNLGRRLAP